MKQPSELTNQELVETIHRLRSRAYRALSSFHRQRLVELESEAERRRLTL